MSSDLVFNKTRIAPTPSGFLHLGNIFSFAVTAALAKKAKAKILLRIDDFDRERTNKLYVQDIFDTLNFLELPWDEGPRNLWEYEHEYSQAHRMELYANALQQLQESGSLFACSCTRADLLRMNPDSIYTGTCRNKNIPLETKNVSWRIYTTGAEALHVKTLQEQHIKVALPASMSDFMVRKKDGFPAYQLISVMDDIHYGIDLVVRGDDLWPSTLAQLYLSSFLAPNTFTDTAFYHHPLMFGADGSKLAKSAGSTSVYSLRYQHKKPAEIYSLLARLLHINTDPKNWQELVEALGLF